MLSGNPAFVTGCTGVTGFNMPTNSSFHNVATGIGPLIITGNAPWGGQYQGYANWTSAMATVTYPWSSTYNGQSDPSGSCILSNGQGGPPSAIWDHLGLIGPALQESIYPIQTYANGGPNFMQSHALLNSYFVTLPTTTSPATNCNGGWDNGSADTTNYSGCSEGSATEHFNYDVNTLTTAGVWFPGRTASDYTEYQNNPNVAPFSGGCTTSGGCSPPTDIASGGSWGFPLTGYCTGSTTPSYTGPGTSCMGFTGAMSATSMPPTLADYHGFIFRPDSPLHSASPDGSGDIGPNIPAIDMAQTLNLYVCATPCGSPGPFPD
jgi:hypothetical protein